MQDADTVLGVVRREQCGRNTFEDFNKRTSIQKLYSNYIEYSELTIIICIEEARIPVDVPKNRDATGVSDADVEFVWLGIPLDMYDIATLACETRLFDAFGAQHLSLVPTA